MRLPKRLKDYRMSKISVVTAITGGKDQLLPQPIYPNVDYIAFMENPVSNPQWEARKACNKFSEPVMNAKIHKILMHKYTDSPYIVWMDGNFVLKDDPRKLIEIMGDFDFAFFKHHARRDIYKEIEVCLKVKKGKPEDLLAQKDAYLKMGVPHNTGMCECGAFIRKNNPAANSAFEAWWAEICRYSSRDQISFPVAFAGLSWATIPGEIFTLDVNKNDFFKPMKHLSK